MRENGSRVCLLLGVYVLIDKLESNVTITCLYLTKGRIFGAISIL